MFANLWLIVPVKPGLVPGSQALTVTLTFPSHPSPDTLLVILPHFLWFWIVMLMIDVKAWNPAASTANPSHRRAFLLPYESCRLIPQLLGRRYSFFASGTHSNCGMPTTGSIAIRIASILVGSSRNFSIICTILELVVWQSDFFIPSSQRVKRKLNLALPG